jgi:hypothetical protein
MVEMVEMVDELKEMVGAILDSVELALQEIL